MPRPLLPRGKKKKKKIFIVYERYHFVKIVSSCMLEIFMVQNKMVKSHYFFFAFVCITEIENAELGTFLRFPN